MCLQLRECLCHCIAVTIKKFRPFYFPKEKQKSNITKSNTMHLCLLFVCFESYLKSNKSSLSLLISLFTFKIK